MRDFQFNEVGLRHRQLGGAGAGQGQLAQMLQIETPGAAANFTALFSGTALIYAWGSGGSGAGNTGIGGGAGGGVYKRIAIVAGQIISYVIGTGGAPSGAGNPGVTGTATTVTLPGGAVLTGPAGQGGGVGALGGTGIGGDVNSKGGNGGVGGAGQAGADGGGAGGLPTGADGGGGGMAGFNSVTSGIPYNNGVQAGLFSPGPAGCGGASRVGGSNNGGPGKLLIFLLKG